MKVDGTTEDTPTIFGIDADKFNKLSEINKLRRSWIYFTSKSSANRSSNQDANMS